MEKKRNEIDINNFMINLFRLQLKSTIKYFFFAWKIYFKWLKYVDGSR